MSAETAQRREVLSRYDVKPLYVNTPAAARIIGTGTATVMRLVMCNASFPRPIYISERKRLFKISELESWVEAQRGKAERPSSIRGEVEKAATEKKSPKRKAAR